MVFQEQIKAAADSGYAALRFLAAAAAVTVFDYLVCIMGCSAHAAPSTTSNATPKSSLKM
jgi:hypothetical protein